MPADVVVDIGLARSWWSKFHHVDAVMNYWNEAAQHPELFGLRVLCWLVTHRANQYVDPFLDCESATTLDEGIERYPSCLHRTKFVDANSAISVRSVIDDL